MIIKPSIFIALGLRVYFYISVNIMLNIIFWARIRTKYFIQMNNMSVLVFLKN